LGNLDQAVACFEDALTFCGKAGYRPELAWTCCDYADTLLQRKEPRDREKAMPSDVSSARNHRALAGTTKLGAPTLLLHPCLPEYTCGRKLADNLRPPKNPR